jgi:ubiquinone/menaquinone biosynthesis C-methylase UbiE
LERELLEALGRHGVCALAGRRILEIGCGTGYWVRQLVQWGASPERVVGIDLVLDRLVQARGRTVPTTCLALASATRLPFGDGTFDLVLQATVFTSILDDRVRRTAAAEMCRVLAPGGLILWYDYFRANPRNPDVRAVTGRELLALFPGAVVERRRVTLAPPIARLLASRSWLACYLLERLPALRTHYVAVIRDAHPPGCR